MSSIVVVLQHQDGKIVKSSLSALHAAELLRQSWKHTTLVGICLGVGAQAAAGDALEYGLDQIFYSSQALFERYLAPAFAAAVTSLVRQVGATSVVMAATSTGKDLAPRVAAALDAAQASDIIAVNSDGSVRRPMYAGDVLADVELLGAMRVVTVRATGFAPASRTSKLGTASEYHSDWSHAKYGAVVSYEISKGGRPELGDAATVVSGGRALQSAENFEKYIFPLADAFGAAVGASRAAVDSGYAPNDWQVGQTGKIVAPQLYVAVGISGAIQHLAGMKDSKVIAAINKDPDAPIYEVADFGLVADLYEAVPVLTAAVKKVKGA